MKPTNDITQELFKAILSKIAEEYLITQLFMDGHVKVSLEPEIDGIMYWTYVDICNDFGFIECDVIFDLYDINGHKIIGNKPNIAIDLDARLIRHYEMVTD